MELTWLRRIDFFPCRPSAAELSESSSICIGTKSRNLGDALVLTTLPAKLKAAYPRLKIYTYPRGFNSIVFRRNPHVSGIRHLPSRVYGDDTNWGEGQLIQLKERFFNLPVSPQPKPELYLSGAEKSQARHKIIENTLKENEGKPLCILHPWGTTRNKVAPVEFWDAVVSRYRDRFRFWQVGIEGQGAIQGCEYYALTPSRRGYARQLFALLSQAQVFVGVDSGPMHVARAFEIPSLIFLNHSNGRDPVELLKARMENPYFTENNRIYSSLYSANIHIALHPMNIAQGREKAKDPLVEKFFEIDSKRWAPPLHVR